MGLVNGGGELGQPKSRHDVGHPGHPSAKEALTQGFAVRLSGQHRREHRVGVVYKLVRQVSVQQRLDAWGGRARVEQVLPKGVHHLLVTEALE